MSAVMAFQHWSRAASKVEGPELVVSATSLGWWCQHDDLSAGSLEMIVSVGNYPTMALF